MMRKIVAVFIVVVGPMWSMTELSRGIAGNRSLWIRNGRLDLNTVSLVAHGLVVLMWFVLLLEYLTHRRIGRNRSERDSPARHTRLGRLVVWALGATTAASVMPTGYSTHQPTPVAVPIGDIVTPMIASSILTQVLLRRREQIRIARRPDRLSEEEMTLLGRVVGAAEPAVSDMRSSSGKVTFKDCEVLLEAVDRPDSCSAPAEEEREWDIKVRLFGYPIAVGIDGSVAEFRKKKALELLVWLVLNKDRARRSAARTCLWDFAINDSTFSTVISDMRRALGGLGGNQAHQQWVPPTYSDVIPLSESIVSDYDLLRRAHQRFLDSDECSIDLANVIAEIRDTPFAGTNYSWPDLDGTTTRLVISALDACRDLAKWALENGRRSELDVAVSAALRVMPGCDEFLEIQNRYLSNAYSYRRTARR